MSAPPTSPEAAVFDQKRRLYVYNGGFLTQSRVKRILHHAGYDIRIGLPGDGDLVGVWGMSPTAHRGEHMAQRQDSPVIRVEDAWLRSLHPGKGEPPLGLTIDHRGVHYDPAQPSDLETLLASHPLDDTALLNRAKDAIERLKEAHLTKYSAVDPTRCPPAPGYVLILDQTEGDASVTASGADRNRFLEMLFVAQEQNPGARVIIKTHPAVIRGDKTGYFRAGDLSATVTLESSDISPWVLFEGAVAVYTVSSQLGFEAIFAGHKPHVFGQPFYAGWGLTQDAFPVQRRQRRLTRAQLFAGAVLLYPKWYDPFRDRLCQFEDALQVQAAITRQWRDDRKGWTASGMSLWKRRHLQQFFGSHRPMIFQNNPAKARTKHQPWMVWASRATPDHEGATRVEDGFIRSRGLGAELVPPLSLVLDDLGIYYDPHSPSRLEQLITQRAALRPDQHARAAALIKSLRRTHVSKYNLPKSTAPAFEGETILVVGQVEDDASVKAGSTDVRTNLALMEAASAAQPNATVLFKPHPDVVAGLREGGQGADTLADVVLPAGDATHWLEQVDEVWTITSLLGFEALIQGKNVVTLGVPFYAGWGLTEDHGPIPPRRHARPTLEGLVHAALIDYPRYVDPVTGDACPVEVVIHRLASGQSTPRGVRNRLLAKLQGLFASQAHLWRPRR
ncbi:MAG: capsular polysaccharide biosynthesis protein [Roseobacter sp.]